MKCPVCGFDGDRVIDSRPSEEGRATRRRRECNQCRNRFTTYEKIETLPLYVVKKDGSREPFDRDKLIGSIMKACNKRPVSMAQIEDLVSRIERDAQGGLNREISSGDIGEAVMEGLRDIDEVGYVRFASVYRQFTDLSAFLDEVARLAHEQDKRRQDAAAEPVDAEAPDEADAEDADVAAPKEE